MFRLTHRYAPFLLVLLAALSAGGCATIAAVTYATGRSPAPDENAVTERVPEPGIVETLTVTFHPAGRPVAQPATQSSSSSAQPASEAPPTPPELQPPVLECDVSQAGESVEYIAATHYGTRWKIATATMFVLEAGLAALYLVDHNDELGRYAAGAFFAADAAGTFGLFWVPERDVFKTRRRDVVTPIRGDCPAGLFLEIGGQSVAVDAGGRLSPLGPELLTRAIAEGADPVRVRVQAWSTDVPLTSGQRCSWAGRRRITSPYCQAPTGAATPIEASLDVPPGALTSLAGLAAR